MASDGWELWVNREDSSVVYQARKMGDEYLVRKPGETYHTGKFDAAFFEATYERKGR